MPLPPQERIAANGAFGLHGASYVLNAVEQIVVDVQVFGCSLATLLFEVRERVFVERERQFAYISVARVTRDIGTACHASSIRQRNGCSMKYYTMKNNICIDYSDLDTSGGAGKNRTFYQVVMSRLL